MRSILFISASPHNRGKSFRIIQNIILHPDFKEDNIQILFPHKYSLKHCTGCEYCKIHKKCQLEGDDFPQIEKFFQSFTHIIIVSPIYFYHLPGIFKILIDRFQPYYYLHQDKPNIHKGFAILYGASNGEKLFAGTQLTLKYFLETVNTDLISSYTMNGIKEWKDVLPYMEEILRKVNSL